MNKKDLIDAIASRCGTTKVAAGDMLDAALDAIAESLVNGDDVAIAGFGSFAVRSRDARTGRNPATGETIEIAASKSVAFKAASPLKKRLTGNA